MLFRAAAISNFIATLPVFFAFDWYVSRFGTPPPRYPFAFWIWAGMAFLWGVMFWEISHDPLGRYAMLKYAWLEKGVTSTAVCMAYFNHNVPRGFMLTILFTDVLWIPLLMLANWTVHVHRRGGPPRSSGPPEPVLAE